MELTFIDGQAQGPDDREESVNFLVDSGAGNSLLPYAVWPPLGLEPTREEKLILADGAGATRNVSRRYIVLPQGEEYSPVVLGEQRADQALPGAVTMENLGLVLNPFSRTLHPMRLLWRG